MPRKRSRSSCFEVLLLSVFALLILMAALVAAAFYLPQRVEQQFGPPAADLSTLQTLRYSVQLFLRSDDLTLPADPYGQEQPFKIAPGESTSTVISNLAGENLIEDAGIFRTYLLYSGLDKTIQSGSYTLSPAMTPLEIAHKLQDATPDKITFNVLAGWRSEEIEAILPTSGLSITKEQFKAALQEHPNGYSFTKDLPADASLEGFLFPGSYTLPRQATADDLISAMLNNFDQQVTPDMRQGFERQGLTLYQAVTLASIIEREAVVHDEMPMLASVFLNRLKANMKLDADPTVQYALGFDQSQNTWWKNPLTLDDLKFDSPYNTYMYGSLPPGPISNPSLDALNAVAMPAQTPYYYFRAACDGSGRHVFAETFEEQLQNACK